MLQLPQLNRGLFEKFGLAGSADILNLYAARAARGFGDGFATIILPAYLLEIYKLAALFSLDAFAGGFTVQSLLALWLFERFDLSLAAASAFFFWSNVLTAFSYPVAARLGKRFGLVNTMVFTHIPSSLCLILAAFSPSLTIVLALLLVRSALSQMDVPTRTSYVMAVVTPAERTRARERHRGSAQLGVGNQSRDVRRAILDVLSRIAARPLRRAEDCLRSRSPLFIPTHKAAGREGGASVSLLRGLREKRVR